ncbi:Subtilase family protein [Nitrosospira multiformis]|uniref:Subtilase family protein n=1 Tax=Nitrosospira multiformis TaxID=1231 RepID=A0A1H8PYB0_9PROT|nr:S8 family peptidase [Nitrosospira multiformis]SEO46718.1 Subtilase family protein [Nitrosospira multiformis]
MVDENQRDLRRGRLPIKLIMPKQGTERRVPGGGTPPQPFREVDAQYRKRLSNQVGAIQEAILPQLKLTKAAPVRVKIMSKAAAKSHRPEKLFSDQSCPIIGAGRLGELFIKATPLGLERLAETIKHNTSEQITKELSCIEGIEAVTPAFRRRGLDARDILRRSPRRRNGFITRVRLFNFAPDADHPGLVANFKAVCSERGIRLDQRGYSADSFIYAAECQTVADLEALSRIIGVRSISHMPLVRTIRPHMLNQQALPVLPIRDATDTDVPVVVVVDSGISDQIPALNSWVVGRIRDVSPPYDQNTDHGTFVAGLICWGREFNPTLDGLDSGPCAVFDLQVIPNDDPARGETSALLESELLSSLDAALQQHANTYKVWNLSLGTDSVCSLDEFSELAEELDNLQEKYQVSFVISAGNYAIPPLLDFPRTPAQLEHGRITSPADSVLGITVGSISHVDYKANGPKQHHPSAFSRHGAGPNYIIKPDLVHYGGSCSTDAAYAHGIRSVTSNGLAEDLGTSFATPLVSRTLAQIYHQITPTPSPVLARALLTHHARDPRSGARVPDGEENFLGFGLPAALPYCLECTPHTATLVFDDTLRPGYFLEWDDFPYPPSLKRNGKYFGEVWMTLAFGPARGARWGTEYCETHIDAHLGVYRDRISRDTGVIKQVFTGLVPPEHRNPGELYEAYQVEKLRKWAPVRTYYGRLNDNGERGNRWRLMLRLLTRHGIEKDESTFKPQPFSLIITIADPERRAPVYDEIAQIVRNRFQAQNLAIRTRMRVQGQT